MENIDKKAETSVAGVDAQLVNDKGVVGQVVNPKAYVFEDHNQVKLKDSDKDAEVDNATVKELEGKVSPEDYVENEENEKLSEEDEKWTDFLKKTDQDRSRIIERLNAGEEVQLIDFLKAGFGFADMPAYLQRDETKKNVSDLKASLIECKKFYRPIEIIPVRTFIEGGLGVPTRLQNQSGITLNDYDIDLLFTRLDGKQRGCAAANVFSDPNYKGKESDFDIRVKLCKIPPKELPTYVREIQVAAVWDEKTRRKTTVAQFGSQESALTLMNDFINESGMTARAAYKLIFYKDGYKKDLYKDSQTKGVLHHDLTASPDIIQRAKNSYEAFKIAFRNHSQYMKNSAAVDALIDAFTSSTTDPKAEAEEYLRFLKNLQEEDFMNLGSFSSVSEKKYVFKNLFIEYKQKLRDKQNFKIIVADRINNATSEYQATLSKPQKVSKKKVRMSKEASYYAIGAHA